MERASLFWFPGDPNALQLIGGFIVGSFAIGVIIFCTLVLIDLVRR